MRRRERDALQHATVLLESTAATASLAGDMKGVWKAAAERNARGSLGLEVFGRWKEDRAHFTLNTSNHKFGSPCGKNRLYCNED